MEPDVAWRVIAGERAALAAMLRALTPDEWDHPSLCVGWSVRDVAAHVAAWPQTTLGQTSVALARAGLRFNRMIHDEAQRRAVQPIEQIVDDLDRFGGSRRHPPGVGHHEGLVDVLVHTQDIAIPLGLRHAMPRQPARECADRWWRVGFPFHARRRLRGCHLVADDVDWAVGSGDRVEGPISSLLLLVTGRRASLDTLTGVGADTLRAQL